MLLLRDQSANKTATSYSRIRRSQLCPLSGIWTYSPCSTSSYNAYNTRRNGISHLATACLRHNATAEPQKSNIQPTAIIRSKRGFGWRLSANIKLSCWAMATAFAALHVPKNKTPRSVMVTARGRFSLLVITLDYKIRSSHSKTSALIIIGSGQPSFRSGIS